MHQRLGGDEVARGSSDVAYQRALMTTPGIEQRAFSRIGRTGDQYHRNAAEQIDRKWRCVVVRKQPLHRRRMCRAGEL